MASNVPKKCVKVKVSGKLSERQQKDLKLNFEEYGDVSHFEPCDATTNVLTIEVTDENGFDELVKGQMEVSGTEVTLEIIDEPTSLEPTTIEIDGITSNHDEDTLELYFSSVKKSEGGDIEEDSIRIEQTKAYVTFIDPKVAARVANKSKHVISKEKVSVKLYTPPKPVPPPKSANNMLLLKNLPKDLKTSNLELYLDTVTDLDYDEDEYSYDIKDYEGETLILVIFKDDADLDGVIDKISNKPLTKAGHYIKAEKVPVCTSVIIKNLTPAKCDEDTLDLYLSNTRKSGVDGYETMEILADDTVIIDFGDDKRLQTFLTQQHKFLGGKAVISRYDFLSRLTATTTPSLPDKSPDLSQSVPLPTPVAINEPFEKQLTKPIADFIMPHLSSLQSTLEGLSASLSLDKEKDCIIVTPISGNEKVAKWKEKTTQSLNDWLCSFDEKKINIPSALQDKIFRLIHFANDPLLLVNFDEKELILHVVGKSDKVANFIEQVEALRDTELVETEDVTMEEEKLAFITEIQSKQLRLAYPDVTFNRSSSDTVLQVKGTKQNRQQFIDHLQNIQFSCEPLPLSPWLIEYLSTDIGGSLLKVCLTGYESTAVTLSKNNMICVISVTKTVTTQLLATVRSKVGEKELKAPAQFKKVCHDQSWLSLCDKVHKAHSVLIGVSSTEDQVIVAGDATQLAASAKIVEKFIADECYGKERVSLKSGQWKYVSHHAMLKWTKLLSKAEENSVSVLEPNEDDKNPTITMEGDPTAIQKILEELNKLITSICTTPMEITRPGTIRFLLSEGGQIMINGIEAREKSCIQLTVDTQGQASQSSKMATSTINSNEKCKATTEEGKLITLAIGDITEYPVDVIVNAANIKLDHADGVAAAIVRKGGRIIQEESKRLVQNEGKLCDGDAVMMKEVGKLPCQRLIHAVGPRWQSGNKNEEAFLQNACMESLNLAINYRSIAFPAISGGIYGFPAAVCAHSMIEAFITWSQTNGIAALHDIHVIVNDPTLANAFTEEMRKNGRCRVLPDFQKSANAVNSASNSKGAPTGSAKKKKRRKLANNASIAPDNHTPLLTEDPYIVPSQQFQHANLDQMPTDSPSANIQFAKQYIELCHGDLLKHQAEVYVNSASSDLDLRNGAIAKSILKAGGQSLQDECSSYTAKHGKVPNGGIVVTGPGKLPCKKIIHTVGVAYDGKNSEKILQNIIEQCLQEADKCQATSIAFPALGAGNLHYPSDVVAKIMVETIAKYIKAHDGITSLETVKLVIFMADTYKEYDRVLSEKPREQSHQSVSTNAHSHLTAQQSDSSFTAGKLMIEIIQGDITEDDSDVVVNPTNERMRLGGGVGKALLRKAGKELENHLNREILNGFKLEEGKLFVTPAYGNLKFKHIYHVISPLTKKTNGLTKAVTTCLKKVDEQKLSSICFPAIGTGGVYKPNEAAQGICEVIIKYGLSNPRYLQRVRVVIFQSDVYRSFIQVSHDILQSSQQPGFFTRALNYFWGGSNEQQQQHSDEKNAEYNSHSHEGDHIPHLERASSTPEFDVKSLPDNAVLHIQIFAGSARQVETTKTRVHKVIQDHFKADVIENDDRVSKLSKQQILDLEEKAKAFQVEIKFEPHLKRIRLKGDKEDVGELKTQIMNFFGRIAIKEGDEKVAKLLQDTTTWKWQDDDGEYEDYDYLVNYAIEQAYQSFKSGGGQVIFTYNDEDLDEVYTINFDKMEESLSDGTTTFPVQRSDIQDKIREAELPPHWDPMPHDSSGKEEACYVVDLPSSSPEYKEVIDAFTNTMPMSGAGGGNVWNCVAKIQRIQNPALYAQYAGRKKIMEKENSHIQNERRLFHGCSGTVFENIYHQGFNRSFAGEHAVVYGNGAYFAVNAIYSARKTYSPPDDKGNRFMFYARVLTGEYAQGKKGLKVPPPKDPSKSTVILFDSVVDKIDAPDMYVVFSDAQCYPEYLITFT